MHLPSFQPTSCVAEPSRGRACGADAASPPPADAAGPRSAAYPPPLGPQMVFGVPPVVTFAVLVPYELRNINPKGGVFITPQTAFTM